MQTSYKDNELAYHSACLLKLKLYLWNIDRTRLWKFYQLRSCLTNAGLVREWTTPFWFIKTLNHVINIISLGCCCNCYQHCSIGLKGACWVESQSALLWEIRSKNALCDVVNLPYWHIQSIIFWFFDFKYKPVFHHDLIHQQ